jgi:hypothetical protein
MQRYYTAKMAHSKKTGISTRVTGLDDFKLTTIYSLRLDKSQKVSIYCGSFCGRHSMWKTRV